MEFRARQALPGPVHRVLTAAAVGSAGLAADTGVRLCDSCGCHLGPGLGDACDHHELPWDAATVK